MSDEAAEAVLRYLRSEEVDRPATSAPTIGAQDPTVAVNPDLQTLADRTGKRMRRLGAQGLWAAGPAWAGERDALLEDLAQLHWALERDGRRLREFGWRISGLRWHREGGAPLESVTPLTPLMVELYRRVGRRIPQGALPWAREQSPTLWQSFDTADAAVIAASRENDREVLRSAALSMAEAVKEIADAFIEAQVRAIVAQFDGVFLEALSVA